MNEIFVQSDHMHWVSVNLPGESSSLMATHTLNLKLTLAYSASATSGGKVELKHVPEPKSKNGWLLLKKLVQQSEPSKPGPSFTVHILTNSSHLQQKN
jgi:hypothetical protein